MTGHEHENYVEHHRCEDPPARATNPLLKISTAAHIDWPQQARMIELVDNGRRLSLCSRCSTTRARRGPAARAGASRSSSPSIGRELAYNDPQGDRGARGGRQDRNVILPTDRPTPPAGAP